MKKALDCFSQNFSNFSFDFSSFPEKMLADGETEKVLKSIRFCSTVLPVNASGNDFDLKISLSKAILCWLTYTALLFHAVYKNSAVIHIILFERGEIALFETILQASVGCATIIFGLWYYLLYVADPKVHVALVRLALDRNGGKDLQLRNVIIH